MLLATVAKTWPDAFDRSVLVVYCALFLGLPLVGYVFMVLDYRAYLRSLRRALIVVTRFTCDLPAWARKDTPRCLIALGLSLPCTKEQVLSAYREKVKLMHPDHGGDRAQFLRLQAQFEQAMAFLEGEAD